jgi:hypothetical protein
LRPPDTAPTSVFGVSAAAGSAGSIATPDDSMARRLKLLLFDMTLLRTRD